MREVVDTLGIGSVLEGVSSGNVRIQRDPRTDTWKL